jgi:hypothetical protein
MPQVQRNYGALVAHQLKGWRQLATKIHALFDDG